MCTNYAVSSSIYSPSSINKLLHQFLKFFISRIAHHEPIVLLLKITPFNFLLHYYSKILWRTNFLVLKLIGLLFLPNSIISTDCAFSSGIYIKFPPYNFYHWHLISKYYHYKIFDQNEINSLIVFFGIILFLIFAPIVLWTIFTKKETPVLIIPFLKLHNLWQSLCAIFVLILKVFANLSSFYLNLKSGLNNTKDQKRFLKQ